jgi:Flp pilus assembly protein protease CpaA
MSLQILLLISFISLISDLYNKKIYNIVLIIGFIALIINFIYLQDWHGLFIGLITGLITLFIFIIPFQKGGIGAGDIKLFTLIVFGLSFPEGLKALIIIFLTGGLQALATSIYIAFKNNKNTKKHSIFSSNTKLAYAISIFIGLIIYSKF